jgi:RHS repeat-associated protein
VIDHIDYSAYGSVLDESSPANGDRFGYAGMERDATTGLDYDRARWYSPVMGRFISEDLTGYEAGDANLYRYVFNIPTMFVDPSGQSTIGSFIGGVATGVIGAGLIGGAALLAGTIGVPVGVISGGLFLVGVIGTTGVVVDAVNNIWCGDWDGLAYNAGSGLQRWLFSRRRPGRPSPRRKAARGHTTPQIQLGAPKG